MEKIKVGDIFEIVTPKGNAYMHYIHKDKITGELVRVLQGLYSIRPSNLEQLVLLEERYIISFPIIAANNKKIIERVGYYPTTNFGKPSLMRSKHIVRGEFQGWHIVNTDNWQRRLVKELSQEERAFSPWGIWNDTLLIERLSDDWKLENWY